MKQTNATLRLAGLATLALSVSLNAFGADADAVIPVAGSLRGGFGSVFKTSAQIHNRTDRAARGEIVFHPANAPASPSDPKLSYDLEPRATVSYDDIVDTLGATGIGSIDVFTIEGAVPAVVARVYDSQETGTSGAGVPLIDTRDALKAGESASLIVPGDLAQFRFNLGIRSLSDGAVVRITVRSEDGITRSDVQRSFPANFFQQQAGNEFVIGALGANDSVGIEVLEGSAVLYGTTTDNTTNDPSIQIAGSDASAPEGEDFID